ncbi:MAG: response regulator [Anaerolineae bacterium]|nr:response regulator [Anaerolineae bacterium]
MSQPKRILIVEDNGQTAEYLGELLRAQGYYTEWAFDREEVFNKLGGTSPGAAGIKRPFDLILLDLMLTPGGIEGFEICRRIKTDDELRHIAVVMVTGLGSTINKAQGLDLGADDYVTKPFVPEELVARIKAALRVRDMEQAVVQRNRELGALNDMSRAVNSSLELDQVLSTTLNQTLAMMSAQAALVALIDAENADDLVLQMHRGIPITVGNQLYNARWKRGTGLLGQVAQRGELVVSTDLSEDQHLSHLISHNLKAAACTPLFSQQGVVGVLAIMAHDNTLWQEHSLHLLEAIGRQVGATVENARLYTRVTQYAQELANSQAQLVQAEKLAAMGRLTIYIAHELNNPLQAVQNCLHLVIHRSLSRDKSREFLAMAQEEVERLIKTVQRMLEFNRPSSNQNFSTDVHAVIEDVLALSNQRIQRANVRVQKSFASNMPSLKANKDQLKQVILNLVINAIEAMPSGGELNIATRIGEKGQWAYIAVRDQGMGLTPQVREHIFEPFYTTKSQGTGVGLSISYGLIEQHGGDILVESTRGVGSCFTIKLPVRPT